RAPLAAAWRDAALPAGGLRSACDHPDAARRPARGVAVVPGNAGDQCRSNHTRRSRADSRGLPAADVDRAADRICVRDRGATRPRAPAVPRNRATPDRDLLRDPPGLMNLATLTVAAAAAAAGVAASGAQAPAPPRPIATIDDFSHGAAGWSRVGHPRLRTRKGGGDWVLTIAAGGLARPLPAGWAASFDLALSRRARARLELGGAGSLQLHSSRGRVVAGRAHTLARSQAVGGWYRVEAATARAGAALDGQAVATSRDTARPRLAIQVSRGSA